MNNIFNVLKIIGAKLKFIKKNSVTVSRKKITSLNIKTIPLPRFSNGYAGSINELIVFD